MIKIDTVHLGWPLRQSLQKTTITSSLSCEAYLEPAQCERAQNWMHLSRCVRNDWTLAVVGWKTVILRCSIPVWHFQSISYLLQQTKDKADVATDQENENLHRETKRQRKQQTVSLQKSMRAGSLPRLFQPGRKKKRLTPPHIATNFRYQVMFLGATLRHPTIWTAISQYYQLGCWIGPIVFAFVAGKMHWFWWQVIVGQESRCILFLILSYTSR